MSSEVCNLVREGKSKHLGKGIQFCQLRQLGLQRRLLTVWTVHDGRKEHGFLSSPPHGTVRPHSRSPPPRGFLLCHTASMHFLPRPEGTALSVYTQRSSHTLPALPPAEQGTALTSAPLHTTLFKMKSMRYGRELEGKL